MARIRQRFIPEYTTIEVNNRDLSILTNNLGEITVLYLKDNKLIKIFNITATRRKEIIKFFKGISEIYTRNSEVIGYGE